MSNSTNQHLILIEGMATYERILSDLLEVELDERIRHLNDFLKIYPDLARAHNDLAVMYYQAENSLKALAHFEKAHKLDPSNIIYRKNLADFYFVELEWTGDAINNYLEILKEHPNDIDSLNALGTISLKIGRKEQARQYFSRTLQIENNNHEAKLALQHLPQPTNETPSSMKQLQHKLSKQTYPAETTPLTATPAPAPTATPTATSFQNLFNTTPQPPVKSSEELYKTAMNLVNADRSEDAIKTLETLIGQDSSNGLAHNDLGVLYQRKGDLKESLEQHKLAVRFQPENSVFQRNLADLLCNGFDEFEEALTIYVKLFGENSYDVETIKAIAHICIEVEKPDDARFFLEKALAIKPWDQEVAGALRSLKTSI
jgi:Flp pilus assembly protein TadD